MNHEKLGAKLVEQLLARGLMEEDLALLAKSDFAAERAAVALTKVVACLCIMVRNRHQRSRPLTVEHMVTELGTVAGMPCGDARLQWLTAHDQYRRRVRHRILTD